MSPIRRVPGEKPRDFTGTLRRLLGTLGKFRAAFFAVLAFAALSTLFNIAGPRILAEATTALANGWLAMITGTGGIDFAFIGKVLLVLLGMYLLSAAFSFVQGWLMSGVSQRLCYDLRRQISEKIDRLPLAYFEKRTVGEVLSRITNDVDTLGQSLNQSITTLITSITTMIGVLIMMLSISPVMTLIALLILPVSVLLVSLVVKFSQKYFRAQQKYLGDVNGQVEEVYSGHNVIQAFNREDAVLAEFGKANDKLYESAWKSQFLSGLMMPVMNFVGNLGYVAVAVAGSIFAVRGVITIGEIQAFIQYVRNFTQPIQQLAQVSNMLQSMAAAAERVFEFLAGPEEDQKADPARRADSSLIDGHVDFDHVRFGYTPEKTVIHDFSCHVEPGQKVAIVGPTGAGKTTMVNLLMRFYDVDSGSITLSGRNVRDFDRSDLREGFGMVLQDTWLFQGHHHGEHPLRPPGRHRRGGHRRGQGRQRGPLHPHAARRLPDGTERGRLQRQPGPEAAADHRPGHPGGQQDPDPGRGHQFGGHPHRAAHPDRHGQPDARPHQLCHRPPALDDPGRRPDPGHARRRHRGAGPARGTAGEGRLLRRTVQQPV